MGLYMYIYYFYVYIFECLGLYVCVCMCDSVSDVQGDDKIGRKEGRMRLLQVNFHVFLLIINISNFI